MKKYVLNIMLIILVISMCGCSNNKQKLINENQYTIGENINIINATDDKTGFFSSSEEDNLNVLNKLKVFKEYEITNTYEEVTDIINENTDRLSIAIITSPSSVDDGSFNEDNYNGILRFIKKHPNSTVIPIRETSGKMSESTKALESIASNYDVVVGCGYQFSKVNEIATNNPDTKFILVDIFPSDENGNIVELDNVYAMVFAEEEAGMYVGMAAALETKTKKVAIVNGVALPSNVNYQYGFMAGVNYVNKYFDKNVKIVELPTYAGIDLTGKNVGGNYTGSFSDEIAGKRVATELIDVGVDIIFVAAGRSGNGVFTIASSTENIKLIGADVDQYDFGQLSDRNTVITSSIKAMGLNVERQLNAIYWKGFRGENVTLDSKTDSTGYVSEPNRNQLLESTIERINKVYELIKKGEIDPPNNFNGYTPEKFKGL